MESFAKRLVVGRRLESPERVCRLQAIGFTLRAILLKVPLLR
jgi:hypothetical protein